MDQTVYAAFLFLAVGLAGGVFSGLLGIGGGVIMVPLLTLAFTFLGVDPQQIYRLAVSTSLASIAFTSLASARAHSKFIPLRWDLIKNMAPWLVLGTLTGSIIAARVSPVFLKAFFTLFIFALGARMLSGLKLKQREKPLGHAATGAASILIGLVSSMIGIGGGSMIVPYLNWNSSNMHSAIGASASLGFFISLSGTAGYILNGLNQTALPWGTLGYIHVPALLVIMGGATLCAPLGVKLAHKLSPGQLRMVFGCSMFLIGTGMLTNLIKNYI